MLASSVDTAINYIGPPPRQRAILVIDIIILLSLVLSPPNYRVVMKTSVERSIMTIKRCKRYNNITRRLTCFTSCSAITTSAAAGDRFFNPINVSVDVVCNDK